MTVRYLTHKMIDPVDWDNCIDQAENGLPYAYFRYIDILTDQHWDALVLDDYKAVMPLPFNTKLFGIKQVYQPPLSQQLGIFGNGPDENLISMFLDAIPKKFRFVHQQLNFRNHQPGLKERTNLILDLGKPYEELFAGFSKTLRKRLRKLTGYELVEQEDIASLINLYRKELENRVHFGEENYERAQRLFKHVIEVEKGKIYSVLADDEVIASGMFLISTDRIINVFGASQTIDGHKDGMTILLAAVIKHYSNRPMLFDFEGSEIPGVRDFFLSFGASTQYYPVLQINRLPWWIKWYKK